MQVPPQLRAAQRKLVRLPHAICPSWQTEAAHVALSSTQPTGSSVVVVTVLQFKWIAVQGSIKR